MPDLLLELFSEEIPARMQRRAAEDLKKLVTDALVARGFLYEGAKAFSTPRRLALHVAGLPARGQDVREERRGPRVGAPDNAVQGFLKSAGLSHLDQARIEKDPKKGEFYVAVIERPGRPTPDVLAEILPAIVRDFPWPKSMRWGAASREPGSLRWVRPLQSILCTFGPETEAVEVVPFAVDGVRAGDFTQGHRFMAPEPIQVRRFDDYVRSLERAKVVLDADRRKDIIRAEAQNLAFAKGLELVEDEALLEEVAGLVEWPAPLMGSFDESFLAIPPEVIRATIRANQKCFVLRQPSSHLSPHAGRGPRAGGREASPQGEGEGASQDEPLPGRPPHPVGFADSASPRTAGRGDAPLANQFILVANLEARDGGAAVVAGNERVVRARLADAKFFWETDRKVRLEDRLEKLEKIVFHEKLGTQYERVERIAALARELAPVVGADSGLAERAARLAKADLVTEMVGEFPELQGLMGRYYAAAQGEHPSVAAAIEEHYKPLGPSDRVPTDPVSVAVALSDKIDTLVGFWAIDEKPTGSKDPYALRRAALGVVRLVLENKIRLSLTARVTRTLLLLLNSYVPSREVVALVPTDAFGYKLLVAKTILEKRVEEWIEDGQEYQDVSYRVNLDQIPSFDAEFGVLPVSYENALLGERSLTEEGSWSGEIEEQGGFKLDSFNGVSGGLATFFADRLKVHLREQGARHDLIDAVFSLGAGPSAPSSSLAGEVARPQAGSEGGRDEKARVGATSSSAEPSGTTPTPVARSATRPSPQGGGEGVLQDDLLMIVRRVEALGKFLDTEDGKNLLAGYRRATNILRIEEKKDGRAYDGEPDRRLIRERGLPEEQALFEGLDAAAAQARDHVAREDFEGAMRALAELRPAVDAFFDKVTVNADDPSLRENRLKLLNEIRRATLAVADFSKIGG